MLLIGLTISSYGGGKKVAKEDQVDDKDKTRQEKTEYRKKKAREFVILAQNAFKEKKYKEGIEYYTKAANHGDTASMCFLGSVYLYGLHGTPKDKEKAVAYYKRAAHKGNKLAQEQLSRCFADGTAEARNQGKSAKKSAKWAEESHKP